MKVMAYYKYGDVSNIQEEVRELPKPAPDEVLIKVFATSINSWDYDMLQGRPIFIRLWGLTKPKVNVLGADVAGIVEAIGENITRFNVGDKVFGDMVDSGWGGFAEYTCAKESSIEHMPANASFVEAASLPQGACMAYQAVIDGNGIKAGDKVLINGAGGGCGAFALQLAKHYGAVVTGVDRADKFDFMKSIGADEVVDYKKQNYTELQDKFDVVIDMVMHHALKDVVRILKPGGRFRMVGGTTKRIIQAFAMSKRVSKKAGMDIGVLAAESNFKIADIKQLVEDGILIPTIDKTFPLNDVPKAMDYIGKGNVKGKIVVKIHEK